MSQHIPIQTSRDQHPTPPPEFASILVVDDQRFDRTRLTRFCRNFDFTTHVVEADTLDAMRDKLKKDRFDLVLLDYHLTDGTGLEGVDLIRADAVNHTAATVMVTGTQENDIAIKALKMGFSDYLTKDELSQETLHHAALVALEKGQNARRQTPSSMECSAVDATLTSFSRECAQDIKPIVSRMMRQMRELREIEKLAPEEANAKVERVEGSLRRLWSFLDELDRLGNSSSAQIEQSGPTVASTRGSDRPSSLSINARVPSERPAPPSTKSAKPPSIFRRRPD